MNTLLEKVSYPVRALIALAVLAALCVGVVVFNQGGPSKPENLAQAAAQECKYTGVDFTRAYDGPSFTEFGNENRRILVDGKPVANAFYNGTGWHIQCWKKG